MAGRKLEKSAADFLPGVVTLPALREAAEGCRGCDLWERATQTVFGEGRPGARVMLVGEQPGDKEDRAGRPFVGPSGQLLDRALAEAGIDREQVYITNAVKHFKWTPKGKFRLHAKPTTTEIRACHPWLAAELSVVKPDIVVCLGASAAQMVIDKKFKVTERRGEIIEGRTLAQPIPAQVMATFHPSAILRMPDEETRERGFQDLVRDLRLVAGYLVEVRRAA
jgi:uracil-DNA glycosylase